MQKFIFKGHTVSFSTKMLNPLVVFDAWLSHQGSSSLVICGLTDLNQLIVGLCVLIHSVTGKFMQQFSAFEEHIKVY